MGAMQSVVGFWILVSWMARYKVSASSRPIRFVRARELSFA